MRQILDRQQGRAHCPSLRVRGSMMSRMASAIMLTREHEREQRDRGAGQVPPDDRRARSSLRAWSIIWPQLPSSPMPR